MGGLQTILLEQRNKPMSRKNRFELGENPVLLPGILCGVDWILRSDACSILADVRYENAKISTR